MMNKSVAFLLVLVCVQLMIQGSEQNPIADVEDKFFAAMIRGRHEGFKHGFEHHGHDHHQHGHHKRSTTASSTTDAAQTTI